MGEFSVPTPLLETAVAAAEQAAENGAIAVGDWFLVAAPATGRCNGSTERRI
jgi:hypothetical protein